MDTRRKVLILSTVFLVVSIAFVSTASVATASVSAQVTSFSPASGTYYPGNVVTSSLSFENTGTERWTFWVGYSVQDNAGRWYNILSNPVTLDPGVSTSQSKKWSVPADSLLTTGKYKVVMALWKTKPENDGAIRLANAEKTDAFQVINFRDNFA